MGRAIGICEDDWTLLTGYKGEVVGPIRSGWKRPGSRGFWDGWTGAGQGFDWPVQVERAGDYELAIVAEGGPQRPMVEAGVDGRALRKRLSVCWDRVAAGRVRLTRGRHTIRFRSVGKEQPLRFISVELVRPSVRRRLEARARRMRVDVSWMVDGVYGLMFHWVGGIYPRRGPSKPYARAARDFPVERFADRVAKTGAAWVYLCTTHCIYHWPGPNAAIDAILPGRTVKRDLIGEMALALAARGVRLGLYYHPGHEDKPWWDRVGFDTAGKRAFVRAWKAVIEDAGRRYGDLVAGWWFDDGTHTYYHAEPPWEELLVSARAGNAQRVILWNAWLAPKVTCFTDTSSWESTLTSDLIVGGGNLPVGGSGRFVAGPQKGLQAHITTLIHQSWEHARRDKPISRCRYRTEQLIAWLKEARRRRAAVTLNLEIYQDGEWSPADVRRFRAIRQALAPA